jgi:hypothetical protein
MAINFPASPTLNQTFSSGNVNYVWDGTKWTASVTGGISLDKIEEGNTSAEVIDTGSDGRFVVTTEGTEKLRVDSNGDVTINDKIVHSGDTNTAIRFPAADIVSVETNGSERLRVDSAGRLLLGTSTARSNFFNGSVSAAFQVEGTNSDTRRVAIISSDTGAAGNGAYLLLARQINGSIGGNQAVTNGDSLGAVSFQGSDGTEFVEGARIEAVADAATSANDVPTRLVLSTTADGASSPTERMRITNAGRVLFGATAPSAENELFSFQGSNGTLSMFNVTGGASQWPIRCWNTAASGTINQILFMDGGGTARGSITTNASSTAYNTTSDYRLKENVELLAGATERLSQIPVHRFNFIGSDATVDGFLAHEAQAIVPECVTGTKDEVDADGNPVYQGIDQSKLVPLLTAALQEAMERIEQLESEMAAVKAQLS